MSKNHRITKTGRGARQRAVIEGSLQLLRQHAAGIDVGSEEHYVSVPPDRDPEPVRHFGCYTSDLHRMAEWLKSCRIETVAMEATGVYWVPVFEILEEYGFEVTSAKGLGFERIPGLTMLMRDNQDRLAFAKMGPKS